MREQAPGFLEKLFFGKRSRKSDERLRELILYIADRSQTDPRFGATKLNKLVFFADFQSYAERGKPITGCQYMRLPNGPVPRHLIPIRDRMIEEGELVVRRRSYGSYEQHPVLALREARLQVFDPEDIDLVNRVIQRFWGLNATELSDLSHDRKWRIAGGDKEAIPYQAAFISNEPITAYEIARTGELAERYGWAQG